MKKNIISSLGQALWSFFLSGLLTILPLALTIALFRFALKLIKGWFEPLQQLLARTSFGYLPHLEIIAVFVLIFIIGVLMQTVVLHSLVNALEKLVFKIPLVRPVYSGIKQLVNAFNPHDKLSFKKVVVIQFPRPGVFSIGFVTGRFPAEISPAGVEKPLFNVFIPHTPNPTSGWLIMLAEEEITVIDLTRQEAMALIISGGIITPERFKK